MNATTIVGNLTDTPDLRQTGSGTAVANFRIAHTPRVFDRESGAFKDGDPLFLSGSVWNAPAENFAASAKKGDRVIVTGRLKPNNYEAADGTPRSTIEIDVEEIGLSTRFKSVTVGESASGGSKPKAEPKAAEPKAKAKAAAPVADDGDDDDF